MPETLRQRIKKRMSGIVEQYGLELRTKVTVYDVEAGYVRENNGGFKLLVSMDFMGVSLKSLPAMDALSLMTELPKYRDFSRFRLKNLEFEVLEFVKQNQPVQALRVTYVFHGKVKDEAA